MRILVVDDSRVVRTRLISLLREIADVEIAGETGDGNEALALTRSLSPDVVILDLHLPGKSGLEVIPWLVACVPPPEVIVLTNQSASAYEKSCLERGARWFFDKSREFHRIVEVLSARTHAP